MGFYEQLIEFLGQAKTENLKTKHFISNYNKTKVKVSFGQGNAAKIPWISFTKEPHTTSKGIYPVYLYYKDLDLLILAYGISETNKPTQTWNITSGETIEEYFKKQFKTKPSRYGDSYIYEIYNLNDDLDKFSINNDLDSIIEEYNKVTKGTFNMEEHSHIEKQDSFDLLNFQKTCSDSGLIFSEQLIIRFITALITKPFVILTGLSGSGKTKLAQAFVQWICQDKSQYSIVPVGADWTNREPLLGYVNALENDKYVMPENGALQTIINANNNDSLPYFIILDEMNLSHVERYFADFLSVMESNENFNLHSSDKPLEANNQNIKSEYKWPKNLFVIGTVNIDETTYMFSPKVLDRANVIEFRVSITEIENFLKETKEVVPLNGEGANMAISFVELAKYKSKSTSIELQDSLNSFFKELKKVGAEFGYRTATEIQTLYAQIDKIDPSYSDKVDEKIDIAIMQKLLPKLHGSRRQLVPALKALGNICYNGNDVEKDVFKFEGEYDFKNSKFPLSLEKITRMYSGVMDNGFVSYAEA